MSGGIDADEEIDFCKVFLRNLPNVFNIEALIWNRLACHGLNPTELFTVNNDDASLCISIVYAYCATPRNKNKPQEHSSS